MAKERDPLAKRVGARMRRRRLDLGWSQATLATHLHTTPEYVSLLEVGARLPSIPTLVRLSHALGLSVDALVAERRGPTEETLLFAIRRVPRELRPHVAKMLDALVETGPPLPSGESSQGA
jgi:transcriptional regulator with XRE-family HTH domain